LSESGVVLCDEHLPDGSWRDLLAAMEPLHDPPVLIVSSHIADERLWSEVLNLGAFDLLAAPFDSREVLRVVSLAWRWWRSEARHLAVAG
jgi:FixJ family two-component response regulator